jgi:hypothetical protein
VVSVFSSVKELWNLGSYPLAIFIVLSSIVWPYVKLFLTLFAWVAPYKTPRRRERLIEVIDAAGKWGFVDIVVLVEIMVAFRYARLGGINWKTFLVTYRNFDFLDHRSTIRLAPTVTLEIVVLAKWGFYVFVFATVMSLLVTHFILHRHRQVHYPSSEERTGVESADPGVRIKERNARISICMLAFVWYMAGCFSDAYQVENTRGDVSFATDYSIVSVGKAIPESQLDPNSVGTRFLQFMWFFLCVVMPLWALLLFGILFAVPLSQVWAERIFFMGGIAFAWSCAEVLLVSSIFAVLQMPTFGDGLIEANCTQCFVIDTKLLLLFVLLCNGTMLCVILNFGLYGHAHRIVYGVL